MNRKLITIKSEEDFRFLIQSVLSSDIISYDVESTGVNVRKDKIIGIAISASIGTAFYLPIKFWNGTDLKDVEGSAARITLLFESLKGKKLVMHNASFDCRITKSNYNIDLLPDLYCDTMLLKHTCDELPPFGLKDIAVRIQDKIGLDITKEANIEQIELKEHLKTKGASLSKESYELYKGDTDIIGKYAAADADLTLRVFKYYNELLMRDNLVDFFYKDEVMPLYKTVTIPMESRGIMLDLDLLNKSKTEIRSDIENLEHTIQALIAPYLAEFNTWFLDLKYPIKNNGVYAQAAAEYFKVDLPKTKTGKFKLDAKSIDKLPPDSEFRLWMRGQIRLKNSDAIAIQESMHEGYKFNLSSKHHLKKLFFNKLKLKAKSFTDKGNPQVDDEFLESIKNDYEFVRLLIIYNRLTKIEGSYIDRFLSEHEDGIFYPSFYQHRTISGRYGSDMQQLPRPMQDGEDDSLVVKHTNKIRKFFISRPGYIFVDADYESLEPHVFAHVSGDEKLKNIFRQGHDFYSTIAIATERLKGVSADKNAENYLGLINKQARQKAKAYSLGIPYGMTGYALSMHIGVSTEEAENLVRGYLNGFPQLKEWMERTDRKAVTEGLIRSEAGRIRRIPQAVELYTRYGVDLLDSLELYKEYNHDQEKYALMKELRKELKNALNNAKNHQIQSLAASIVSRSSIAINNYFTERNIDAKIVLSVHDQIIVECHEQHVNEVKEKVREYMENTYKLSINLKAPPSIGKNFYESH